jgi:hypothetical protein
MDKLKLIILKPFSFNNNEYYALAYNMTQTTPGSTI